MNWEPNNSITYGGYKSGDYKIFEDECEGRDYVCAFYKQKMLGDNIFWGETKGVNPFFVAKERCEEHAQRHDS